MDRIATLSEILRQNPADTFARYGLAMALASANQPESALEEYNSILASSPDYVPAYQMSAQLLLQLGRIDQARERLQQGLAVAERTSNAHAASELAAMLEDIGQANA